jgi:hypothetical protein
MKTKNAFKNRWWTPLRKRLALSTGALILCVTAVNVTAQTSVVTNCTEAALRTAMEGGGTVTFACDGTITLTDTVTNQLNTVLDGSGYNVTISGGNAVRVLYNSTNTSLTLINVTIANGGGSNGAGIFNDGGQLNLSQVVFESNSVWSSGTMAVGGAILNSGGTVNATNCIFFGNQAHGDTRLYPGYSPGHNARGGAIENEGVLNLANCTFIKNSAVGGTGVGDYLNQDGPAGGDGEGGAVWNSGRMFVSGCTFNGNSAIGGSGGNGGAPYRGKAGGLPGRLGGSGGSGSGGAICNMGSLMLQSSVVVSNDCTGARGGNGSAGANGYNGLGGAGGNGGGSGGAYGSALDNNGTAALVNDTLAFNTDTGSYGGNGGNGSASTASGFAGGNGGNGGNGGQGSGCIAGPAYITNCTVAFNSGVGGAGGIGGTGGAGGPGGQPGAQGYPGTNGAAVGGLSAGLVVNTIVAGNAPSNGSGPITDAGHNLSSDATCAFTNVGSMNNTDPRLGPLADNGGPTLTMALLPGSPAIDAGDDAAAPPTDQRGFPRPFGAASDIGACEFTPPTWGIPLPSQTAEAGSTVDFTVDVVGFPAPVYFYYFNGTNLIGCGTNCWLELTNCRFSQSGAFTVAVSNIFGAVTSAPVMLNVIPSIERRPVPAINLMGDAGTSLNVEYTDALSSPTNWPPLDTLSLTNPPQYCFDISAPLPPQRFYRAWQAGTPTVVPSLDLNFVPAITLTGNIGDKLSLDYINQIGPTDAWVILDTVTLTNTSQLYFDTSSIGQPARLYRIVPVP